jgi:hypothetical protein
MKKQFTDYQSNEPLFILFIALNHNAQRVRDILNQTIYIERIKIIELSWNTQIKKNSPKAIFF